jgi:hypothetical protein
MSVSTILEYSQNIDNPLILEYFYKGEKIDDPELFFDLNPGLFETVFPSAEETQGMINKYIIYRGTHKLVISDHGFHLIHR